ncbi:MAG: type II secretion system F family protein [Candidatus Paceibacterota bacterium]
MDQHLVAPATLIWVAISFSGLAVGWLAWQVMRAVSIGSRTGGHGRYEEERRERMRATSRVYRWFEPAIDRLAKQSRSPSAQPGGRFQSALRSSSDYRGWHPAEFIAMKSIEGALVSLLVMVVIWAAGFVWTAALLAVGMACGYPLLARHSLLTAWQRRVVQQRRKLPFVVDQIALMMQVGAAFDDGMRSVVMDNPHDPLSEELAIVLADCQVGRTRRNALHELRERVPDPDLADFVFAVTKGEELGTPLTTILSDQAEQMRGKRAQWGEKTAAEAEVNIVFPGILVMVACLIVVVAPIILPAIFNVLEN